MSRSRLSRIAGRAMLSAAVALLGSTALAAADPLLDGFRSPPDGARPRVWWHWLSGNVAKPGIAADLAWMKRVGLGGVQMFDGDMGAPQIVDHRVKALSPEWLDDLRFAASEADRLGLEFAMAAAPGWSETGGPWVTAQAGMKKVAWSETRIQGGRFDGRLAPPPMAAGPFQELPKREPTGKLVTVVPPYFHDIAVLAYRAPAGDVPLAALNPRLEASVAGLDLARLVDGRLADPITLPTPTEAAPTWVSFTFDRPQTMRALTMVGPFGGRFADGPEGRVEASDDGQTWRTVRTLVGPAHNAAPERSFAFPATTARRFRVLWTRPEVSREPYPRAPGIPLAELALVPGARVDLFEDKAGFGVLPDLDIPASPTLHDGEAGAIPMDGVLDLSAKLRADGTLNWRPPAGDWIVLRMGYAPTGEINHPATPEATGPEADKLNAAHVQAHLDGYMAPVIKELGPLIGAHGLRALITDSWEAGTENWTEAMAAEFKRRRGYDLGPWLPVLAGRVVGSVAKSDAFLWDYRRTLADLLAENHYGTITRFAKAHGLSYYGEAVGAAMPTVADGMLAKSYTDIPMGEFWAMPFGGKPAAYQGVRADEFPADIIETASTAHVYGKPLVAAEALTSSQPQWTATPWALKWVADKYMAMGVNRLVIHTSPHQPDPTGHKPGLTLGPFGQAFTRNETWAGMARPWIDYLSRSSFLLQQGQPVADILYFTGEGATTGVPYRGAGTPADPQGYGFDYVNADALLRLARADGGRIAFPGGASYRLLVLPDRPQPMSFALAQRLDRLVRDGAVLLGPRPTGAAGMDDDAAVTTLVDGLWGDLDGRILTRRAHGLGSVFSGRTTADVLAELDVLRDFAPADLPHGMELRFAHRRLTQGDLYFVTNQSGVAGTASVRLRADGVPELWHADTGRTTPATFHRDNGATDVTLPLQPYEAVFVVVRPGAARAADAPAATLRPVVAVAGPWDVAFPAGWGAPSSLRLPQLASWTGAADPGVRYFSGAATYTRTLVLSAAQATGTTWLDLGEVGSVADVSVNGRSAGVAWKPPYRVDVTGLLKPGRNALRITVANIWRNRFVGDRQPGAKPLAFSNGATGGGFAALGGVSDKDTPLVPSGRLGPVRVRRVHATSSGERP